MSPAEVLRVADPILSAPPPGQASCTFDLAAQGVALHRSVHEGVADIGLNIGHVALVKVANSLADQRRTDRQLFRHGCLGRLVAFGYENCHPIGDIAVPAIVSKDCSVAHCACPSGE